MRVIVKKIKQKIPRAKKNVDILFTVNIWDVHFLVLSRKSDSARGSPVFDYRHARRVC